MLQNKTNKKRILYLDIKAQQNMILVYRNRVNGNKLGK